MKKAKKAAIYIQTDMGKTVVKTIPSNAATKIHKCPCCDSYTDFYEEHILLLPIDFPGNRRYLHTHCFETLIKSGLDIVLHPNLPYLSSRITEA